MDDTQAELSAALVAAQADLRAPIKNREVTVRSDKGNYKFKYATFDGIIEDVLRPALPKHGLWFVQFVRDGQMVTRIIHASGQFLDAGVPMPGLPNEPQKAGSALSYFKRYSLCSAFGLAAEEDDDGNMASGNHYAASDRGPAAGDVSGFITDAQRDLLATMASAIPGDTLARLCSYLDIYSLKDLRAERYEDALAALKKKAAAAQRQAEPA